MTDFDAGDSFMMNINMSAKSNNFNMKTDKKKDKKDKYLERKLLQTKRKREKGLEKSKLKAEAGNTSTADNQTNDNNQENTPSTHNENNYNSYKRPYQNNQNNKNYSNQNSNANSDPTQENKVKKVKDPSDGDELIDELNDFYEKTEKTNNPHFNSNAFASRDEKNKKKRVLQNEIREQLREISQEQQVEQERQDKVTLDKEEEIKLKAQNEILIQNNSKPILKALPDKTVFSVKNFEDLDINKYLKRVLAKNNYTQMTKVQKKGIPILLKHKNVVVKSETGSGKTLAYVIPIYELLSKLNAESKISRTDGVYVIIFAPTHELCLQIEETFNKLRSACINAVYGSLMGGQKIDKEKEKLRKGLNIIITTPGRLFYHLKNTANFKFDKLKLMIFDEADRLLDMGFEKDIKGCLSIITQKTGGSGNAYDGNPAGDSNADNLTPENFKKQKIFLISATIDHKIRTLVEFLMKGFKSVGFDLKNGEDEETNYQAASGLNQFYCQVYDEFRLVTLLAFLRNNLDKKIIVFVSTCCLADFIYDLLVNIEVEKNIGSIRLGSENNNMDKELESQNLVKLFPNHLYRLHGKMDHIQRKTIFKEFNIERPGVLISTDVASRGLDFPMVDWIVHYDINPDPKEYLNRMGRSARLDQTGNSLIFLMKHEMSLIETAFKGFSKDMKEMKNGNILLQFINKINSELLTDKIRVEPDPYKDEVDENEKFRKKYFFAIHPLQRMIKSYLFKNRDNLLVARKAFKSSVKSYTTFMKTHKDVFNVKQLNLTRYARSFGLYKETTKIKIGEENMMVDYQVEKNKTRGNQKFNSKNIQRKLINSEFDG